MTLFASLVDTSQRVAASSARLAKVRELAEFLRALRPEEIGTAVHYLAGETPQGRIGIGYAMLQAAELDTAAAERTGVGAAQGRDDALAPGAGALTIADVDHCLDTLAGIRGAGSTARRGLVLRDLFARSTSAERAFLLRLLVGELRQGALAGVMVDAIAAAADLPVARVRSAAMYSKGLGALARAALTQGAEALGAFQLELFSPVVPMLAQTAADVAEALRELPGDVAFEWKMDGARIQVHKMAEDVRVYTRGLNEVSAAVPEIADLVRGLQAHSLVLDGEAIAFDSGGRPQPFQVTMRRFGRRLDVEKLRAELPIRAFFFDCLRLNAHSLADRSARERFRALTDAVPAAVRIPQLITSSEPAARSFYEAALAAGHEGVMAKALDAVYEAGNRGASWLKIKRAHTLDLVVLAAEWGHGRRTGKLSNLHLGAIDPATGDYVMLGKTFKGLTDTMLEWQTQEFLARETHRDHSTVYIRPELVAEIAFSDLQTSIRYPGGVALRLARVKRYRDDKRARDADTMESVRRIFAAQTGGVHS